MKQVVKRAKGKKLIGAQASEVIWAAVDEWLRRNPKKSVTDFVLEACMEKLDQEKIPYDHVKAMFDGRRRVPGLPGGKYPEGRPDFYLLNEKVSDSTSSDLNELAEDLMEAGLAEAERLAAANRPAPAKKRGNPKNTK